MKEKCFDKAAQVWTTTFEYAWSVSFCPETLQEQLSLSVCVPQRSWSAEWPIVYIDDVSAALYWQFRRLVQFSNTPHAPTFQCQTQTFNAAFFLFCYYDWSLMSKIHVTDCVNTAAWYLSSFALDLWKSWTWCVLICLCALCIVCRHMSVRPRSVLRSHSRVLEGSWRRGTSASSFIALVWWKWDLVSQKLDCLCKAEVTGRATILLVHATIWKLDKEVYQNWPSLCCVVSAYCRIGTRTLL